MTLQEAFDAGFEAVKAYVDAATAAFDARVAVIEKREPVSGPKGDRGEPGEAGKSVDPSAIAAMVQAAVDKAMAQIEAPKDGRDGKDAPPVTREAIVEALSGSADLIAAAVASHLDQFPPAAGAPGKDGMNGRDGAEGPAGASGRDGIDGKDGVGLAGALLGRQGNLILTLTDGSTRDLGIVTGADGKDGAPGVPGLAGRDGFTLDQFSAELLADDQTVRLKFTGADGAAAHHDIRFPVPVDKGVWRPGDFAKGAAVTFGGSVWIAQRDTSDKPETSDAWRLAVKRGRDGRDAESGKTVTPKQIALR